MFYTDVNSVVGRMDELRERVKESNIIGIVEKWATENISDAELKIDGTNMFRLNKKSGVGGGILLYKDEVLNSNLCSSIMNSGFEELVWCTIDMTNKDRILVGLCYRSPASKGNNNDKLLQLLDNMSSHRKFTHIINGRL